MKKKRIVLLFFLILAVILIILYFVFTKIVFDFQKSQTEERKDWSTETGRLIENNREYETNIFDAPFDNTVSLKQIIPEEVDDADFTYYTEDVQRRLQETLQQLLDGKEYDMDDPLAVWCPFGTASNSLYLYFGLDYECRIEYTIKTSDPSIPEFTSAAYNAGTDGYSSEQEFQVIGLVPGEENTVTVKAVGKDGSVMEQTAFTIQVPESVSGFENVLKYKEGSSREALTDGLYYAMGLGDYYGYTFFLDNHGILRYEMLLEGYHSDRILEGNGYFITCVGDQKIARINHLGCAEQIYELGQYRLHHDINFGEKGKILALADDTKSETVEDRLIEIDTETGKIRELIDFTELLHDYFITTHEISASSASFWDAGKWDWLHLNSVQHMEDDSVIVSSRETSTIIKVGDIHQEPEIEWMIGDNRFWAGTPYEDFCMEQRGDFTLQYGQHDVEVIRDDSLPEGQYYIRMFNNNYWSLSSRDNYEPELDPSVGTKLPADPDKSSYVYFYLVDEKEKTFELAGDFEVPYSSVVSNAQQYGENYIVNSGVYKGFGEYDSKGDLIREFSYNCSINGYRVMKSDMKGVWFW